MSVTGSARLSRAQHVATLIEDALLADRTPVGTLLGRRTDLMKRYRISPTVMNEALRILRDRGLIDARSGARGGIFVAAQPPHIRGGGIDFWFSDTGRDPLELYEARMHLEDVLTRLAVDRAGPDDLRDMEWALDEMRRAENARAYFEANLRLHRAIARSSRLTVLTDIYEAIATLLSAGLTRVVMIEDNEELVRHNIAVHHEIITAIRERDREALDKALRLHHHDLVRATDPSRSPTIPD